MNEWNCLSQSIAWIGRARSHIRRMCTYARIFGVVVCRGERSPRYAYVSTYWIVKTTKTTLASRRTNFNAKGNRVFPQSMPCVEDGVMCVCSALHMITTHCALNTFPIDIRPTKRTRKKTQHACNIWARSWFLLPSPIFYSLFFSFSDSFSCVYCAFV